MALQKKLQQVLLKSLGFSNKKRAGLSKMAGLLLNMGYDRNHYSVDSKIAGKTATVRATAGLIRVIKNGAVVGEHIRQFGRDKTIYDPWHYLGALEHKPGVPCVTVHHSKAGSCPLACCKYKGDCCPAQGATESL